MTSYLSENETENLQNGDVHLAQIPDFEMEYLENHLAHWGQWWLVLLHFSRSFIWAFFRPESPFKSKSLLRWPDLCTFQYTLEWLLPSTMYYLITRSQGHNYPIFGDSRRKYLGVHKNSTTVNSQLYHQMVWLTGHNRTKISLHLKSLKFHLNKGSNLSNAVPNNLRKKKTTARKGQRFGSDRKNALNFNEKCYL